MNRKKDLGPSLMILAVVPIFILAALISACEAGDGVGLGYYEVETYRINSDFYYMDYLSDKQKIEYLSTHFLTVKANSKMESQNTMSEWRLEREFNDLGLKQEWLICQNEITNGGEYLTCWVEDGSYFWMKVSQSK